MKYICDANVFMTAKNLHYGMDFVPGFWEWIEQKHQEGLVFTTKKVSEEIAAGGDELAEWLDQQPASFALSHGIADDPALKTLAAWAANHPTYTPAAKADFLSKADYFLVAQAATLGYTVVTHEVGRPEARKIVKIPDACRCLGVQVMTPFAMLRAEKARFTL